MLLLDADLSPHQAVFDDLAASNPQNRSPVLVARGYSRFSVGIERGLVGAVLTGSGFAQNNLGGDIGISGGSATVFWEMC